MLAVMIAGQRWGNDSLAATGLACAFLAAALSLYWLLTYDWAAYGSGKFALLQQIGLWIQARRPPFPVPEDINANVAGAGLAVLLPLGLGGVAAAWRERPLFARIGLLWVLLAGIGLLLTASRGAWLGLAVGVGVAALPLAESRLRPGRSPSRAISVCLLLLPVTLASLFVLAVNQPQWMGWLGQAAGVENAALGRVALWQHGVDLVRDYPFTGSGLQGPMMVHSSYVLLLHVGFISHLHNLFLEVAVEQGLPGLLALLGLLVLAIANLWRTLTTQRSPNPLALGALAALVALTVHGMVDAGLYFTKMTPVLFVALGFGLGAGERGGGGAWGRGSGGAGGRGGVIGWMAGVGVLFLLLALPPVRSAFQGNLGAVAQTRAELSVYTWPDWPIQDALRRSDEIDLGPALLRYGTALALDPANVTANRRLGQIQLSQGDYGPACTHIAAAYAATPAQRATRQLQAECQAISGQMDEAAALLSTVDTSQGQWQIRAWWHSSLGETAIVENLKKID